MIVKNELMILINGYVEIPMNIMFKRNCQYSEGASRIAEPKRGEAPLNSISIKYLLKSNICKYIIIYTHTLIHTHIHIYTHTNTYIYILIYFYTYTHKKKT